MQMSRDSVFVVVYDTVPDSKILMLDSASTVKVYKGINNKSNWDLINDWLPWLGFIISALTAWYALKAIRRDKDKSDYQFLFDENKILIDKPYLWAIHDNRKHILQNYLKGNKSISKAEADYSIRAFGYFLINNFEFIFNNRKGITVEVWENYMIYMLLGSTELNSLVKDSSESFIFGDKYRARLKELLSIANNADLITLFKEIKPVSKSTDNAIVYNKLDKLIKGERKLIRSKYPTVKRIRLSIKEWFSDFGKWISKRV